MRPLVLLWVSLAVAGCGGGPIDTDRQYSSSGYRPAYSECEYNAQKAAAGATMAERVASRSSLLQACLTAKGY